MIDPRREQKELTEEQIARVYRQLADDHAAECAQAAAQRTWKRLEHKLESRSRRTFGQRLAERFGNLSSRARAWFGSRDAGGWSSVNSRAAFLTLAAAVALVAVIWFQRPSDLRYQVVGAHSEGGWLHSHGTPVLLEFSDGSELQMRAESSMSFDVVGHRSAISRLSKGELRVDVRHAEQTDWRFFAGPFEVRVVGTKFDLAWRDDKLTVAMREGKVRIVGPDREWTVAAGERFEMTGRGALENLTPHPAVALVTAPDQPNPGAQPEHPAEDVSPHERVAGRDWLKDEPQAAARGTAKPTPRQGDGLAIGSVSRDNDGKASDGKASDGKAVGWEQLLVKGQFATLLSEAKSTGIDAAIQSRSSGELVALAQAARYSKEAGLARKVWQGVRGRFAGSAAARDAAFFLARVDEHAGRHTSALELYRAYLREGGQNGAYAPEAMGRRLVLLRRSNAAAAVEEARRYLTRFPSGPYAKLARDTVGSER